jgi:DNA polymerase III gamma/tau subunit
MQAYIITGGSVAARETEIQKRLADWNIRDIDRVDLAGDEEHVGIDAIRLFQKRLLLTPFASTHTVGVIRKSDRLTQEAQNALLKLLEEPPAHAYILCEVASASMLLPTVISRCEVVMLHGAVSSDETVEIQETIQSLLAASEGKKLNIIDGIAVDRVSTKQWVNRAITALRQTMLSEIQNDTTKNNTERYVRLLRLLLSAREELEVNVNPKLVLDSVFLSI